MPIHTIAAIADGPAHRFEQKRRRDEKREMERAIFELYLDDERSRQDCRILGVELDLAIEDEERATERVKYFADRLLFTQLFMCDDDESWEEFEWEDA